MTGIHRVAFILSDPLCIYEMFINWKSMVSAFLFFTLIFIKKPRGQAFSPPKKKKKNKHIWNARFKRKTFVWTIDTFNINVTIVDTENKKSQKIAVRESFSHCKKNDIDEKKVKKTRHRWKKRQKKTTSIFAVRESKILAPFLRFLHRILKWELQKKISRWVAFFPKKIKVIFRFFLVLQSKN